VHHVGILYDQFMMHGQRNIKFCIFCSLLCHQNLFEVAPIPLSVSFIVLQIQDSEI